VRAALKKSPPVVLFGSNNERIYAAELGLRSIYIPASFPGAIIRRATGTPFMGYAGATYIVQEFCNALFDMLFNMLPLGRDLDQVEPTLARGEAAPPVWEPEARALFDDHVETEPFLIRISAAKKLRERIERDARREAEPCVTAARVATSLAASAMS
jgi:chlorophyllide a reductase subunit Z